MRTATEPPLRQRLCRLGGCLDVPYVEYTLRMDKGIPITGCCKVPGCEKRLKKNGKCVPHLESDPTMPRCLHGTCERAGAFARYCSAHYSQFRRHGRTVDLKQQPINQQQCAGPGCERKARIATSGLGPLCNSHHTQWLTTGRVWVFGTGGNGGRKPTTQCVECGAPQVVVWGRCKAHAKARAGTCWLPQCDAPGSHKQSGLCERHRRAERFLVHKYGFGLQEYLRLSAAQGDACGACKRENDLSSSRTMLHVDHCHATGKVRGLLCGHCNRGLGLFGDSVTVLRGAIAYLEKAGGPNSP